MRRLIERLLIVGLALGGVAYGERVVREVLSMVARLDPAHVHGVNISGSPLGFIEAAIAAAVIALAVIPAITSVFEVFDGRKVPATLVIGELVAALLLFGASERVLHESVHACIVATSEGKVLAVRASATTEVVE
jgi:hypothetical protein